MKTQTAIGLMLSLFTMAVIIGHSIHGTLLPYAWFYFPLFLLLFLSSFFESAFFKAIQVLMILFTGFFVSYQNNGNEYIGIIILAFAYIQAFSYGFLSKATKIKTTIWAIVYFLFFSFTCSSLSPDFVHGFLRLSMCIVLQTMLWINARHIIEKAERADRLELELMEKKLINSVQAGLELVKEIKSEGSCDGTKE